MQRQGLAFVAAMLGGLPTLCFLVLAAHAFGLVVGIWPLFGAAASRR
jgi:PAT family beta-lactamase induction signal transducer AmpG